MKKRSLFAAVAMLIVSAIVLTSATYAWFASGTSVSVAEVKAEVSNSDGSILISADGTNWGSTVSLAQLQGQAGNSIATNFAPVSVNPTNLSIVGGSITSGAFTPAPAVAGSYIKYTVYVKSDTAVDANVTPTFNFGTGFIYGLVKTENNVEEEANLTVRNVASNKYYPVVVSSGADIIDANGNSILDDAAHDAYSANGLGMPGTYDTVDEGILGDLVTPDTNALTIHLTPGTSQAVTVMLWAEGQNTACSGTVPAANSTAVLNIAKVGA